MGNQWSDVREDNQVFDADQVETILNALGMPVIGETETNFLVHCPFHYNNGTPAMSISKETMLYMCFNPDCGVRGNAQTLVMKQLDKNKFQANRFISKYRKEVDVEAIIRRNAVDTVIFEPYDTEKLLRFKRNFPGSAAQEYMRGRGFHDDTLDYFNVGKWGFEEEATVTVPMCSPDGIPVGYVGRRIDAKIFANSPGLPKNKVPWNFHKAKLTGDSVIVVESTFDAMRIHQSGYPNVVAILGSTYSKYHADLMGKSFSTIIHFGDAADAAGKKLDEQMMTRLPHKRHLWCAQGPEERYFHGAKDATDLTDDEIRFLLRNAVSTMEFNAWYN